MKHKETHLILAHFFAYSLCLTVGAVGAIVLGLCLIGLGLGVGGVFYAVMSLPLAIPAGLTWGYLWALIAGRLDGWFNE